MKAYVLLVICIYWFGGGYAIAQTCPQGIPSGGNPFCVPPPSSQNSPYYQGPSQYQQMAPLVREPYEPESWGSIAVDTSKQVAGFSKGMETYRQAEKTAIKDCKSKGGKSCKIDTTYSNHCVGMAVGRNATYRTMRAETEEKALYFAMTLCEHEGGVKCHVYYAGCSYPDRVE